MSIAEIDVAEFTTTLLTASIPLGTVTVSPVWKLVLTPVIVTMICVPIVEAIVLGFTPVNNGAVGPTIVVSLNNPGMMNDAICPRVTDSSGQ